MTQTALIKYVFIDVVGFTRDRSVEAQSEIVKALNEDVLQSLSVLNVDDESRILLPTGDGLCIALMNQAEPDLHVRLACDLVSRISTGRTPNDDAMRSFSVRVGVNENVDNLVTDVNGCANVAGLGVNMAQRIMTQGDGNQIMVGSAVYEILKQRERYMDAFRRYTARSKHGLTFPVYQLTLKLVDGLNVDIPLQFRQRERKVPQLNDLTGHFFALSLTYEPFLRTKVEDPTFDYVSVVLLYLMAHDAAETDSQTEYDEHKPRTWGAFGKSFDERYDYYKENDFWILVNYAKEILDQHLHPHWDCFAGPDFSPKFPMLNEAGRDRLMSQRPDLWTRYGLDGSEPSESL